ncbi:MAG: hypothetical protein INQ03_01505 [Candidatus Heimdallarchaeota archaeon]|nr:hypothetical protein [Candidatus Heimdallarchaeota archaeon]
MDKLLALLDEKIDETDVETVYIEILTHFVNRGLKEQNILKRKNHEFLEYAKQSMDEKPREAIKFLNLILISEPDDISILNLKELILYNITHNSEHYDINDWEEWISILSLIRRINPENTIINDRIEMLELKADIFFSERIYDQSISIFRQILRIDPNSLKILEKLSKIYIEINSIEDELRIIYKMLELDPNNNYAMQRRKSSEKLIELERKNQLAAEHERRIEQGRFKGGLIDKNAVMKYLMQGNKLMNQRKYRSAIEKYDIALSHDPLNTSILLNKANAFTNLELPLEALEILQEAINIDPDNTMVVKRFEENFALAKKLRVPLLSEYLVKDLIFKYRKISFDDIALRLFTTSESVKDLVTRMVLFYNFKMNDTHVYIEGIEDNQGYSGQTCVICKTNKYDERNKEVICIHCEYHFHRSEFLEWVKLHDTCPVCKKAVDIKNYS